MLSGPFVRAVSAVVALVLLLGWVVLVAIGVIYSWKSGDDPSWITGDGLKLFLPGLTALVGGVIAVAFGVKPPPAGGGGAADRTAKNIGALANVLAAKPLTDPEPPSDATQSAVAKAYVVAYLLAGFAAAVTWVVNGDDALEFVKTLASAWGGLVIAIAGAFLRTPST
ncbi:MAG: hypothetical protein QOG86_1576 [Thermoleophilaceae bacterium]|nr:hypothetical protein [Thermoleophilaceae bacterium]MEA2350635.1 hypothetical protein [Thermoleophilaceae bacterium]